ncbi:TRAP transporter TatT component family protein [Treponema sp.]|uniref:TRAP transporter TatT component family protein n=1 Tax=Treponema sp. TaxID=166 RepID=UPI00298DA8BF|nr:TRAP transporter TatT component family protein [Treponema sp.]MCR5613743.1 TRAP transporter TatT component family protein [Treponema sp.]
MKLYSKICVLLVSTAMVCGLTSCKTMILNAASDALSSSDKKGVPAKVKPTDPNPMMAFMGEKDPVIVREVLPTILKLYEIMHIENPEHQGNTIMLGSLNVMYANLCVESKAELMTDPRLLDEQVAEFERAKLHYMRGHDLIFGAFDSRWPGFYNAIMGTDEDEIKSFVNKLSVSDVNAAYWACAGFFASFALNPLDSNVIGSIKGHIAVLEKAAELDPSYSNGAIWEVLTQIYVAAPMDFGGDYDRGVYCYEQALKASGGKLAGIYVTNAKTFCIPAGDKDGFVESLEKALSINVDDDPSQALMNVLNQEKAQRLLDHIDDYFIEW